MADDTDWIVDFITQIIRSSEFRNPIDNYIEDNCGSFIGIEENTFEQGEIHREFMNLIDNLLEIMIKDFGVTDEMFVLASKLGWEGEDKQYYEQWVMFTNYNYFKNWMTKKNLELEELAYKKMKNQMQKDLQTDVNKESNVVKENEAKMKEIKNEIHKREEEELECALKMSLELEEEKRKLKAIEDLEMKKIIRFGDKMNFCPIMKAFKENPPKKQINQPQKIDDDDDDDDDPPTRTIVEIIPITMSVIQDHETSKPNNCSIEQKDVKSKEMNNNIPFEIQGIEETNWLSQVPKYQQNQAGIVDNQIQGKESLMQSLSLWEGDKAQKLKEYKEMILKMKKQRRQNQENRLKEDIMKTNEFSEDMKLKMDLRLQLAERLKQKRMNFHWRVKK